MALSDYILLGVNIIGPHIAQNRTSLPAPYLFVVHSSADGPLSLPRSNVIFPLRFGPIVSKLAGRRGVAFENSRQGSQA